MIALDRPISRNLNAPRVESEVDREILMLRLVTDIYYGLKKVGAGIWGRLSSPIPVAEICTALMEHDDVDRETCKKQVVEPFHLLRAEVLNSIAES